MAVYTNGMFNPQATAAHNEQMAAMAPVNAARAQASGNVLSTIYSQPAQFANVYGGMFGDRAAAGAQGFGAYTQGLGSLGNSQANAYNSYASGMGNVANAMSNERGNFYSANAMAEAARQGAAANIGAAALGAYGSASNSAMNAWAQNQTSYNKALSDMTGANQTGLSNYGVGRNQALAGLGNAYATSGVGFAGANVLSDLDLNAAFTSGGSGYGGGFSAGGPDGDIASGSYGPTYSDGSSFNIQAKRKSDGKGFDERPTMEGLGRIRSDIMASDVTGMMNDNYNRGMSQLDAQHYSSRDQPSQMMGQSLQGLLQLSEGAYGQSSRGMDQFYGTQNDPRNRADYSPVLSGLESGLQSTASRLDGLAGQMGDGYRDFSEGLDSSYMNAMGQVGRAQSDFQSASRPAIREAYGLPMTVEELRQKWAADDAIAARAAAQRQAARESSATRRTSFALNPMRLRGMTDQEVRSIASGQGVDPKTLRPNINSKNSRR